MKKIITITITTILLCAALIGCGKKDGAEEALGNNRVTRADDSNDDIPMADTERIFGKVESIEGNELTLLLATFLQEEEDDSSQSVIEIDDGEITEATAMEPAQAMPADGEEFGMPEGLELDYTGERITVTLPAGVTIYSKGAEASMTDIKKGSVIDLFIDNMEDLNVSMVSIWE